MSVRQPGLIDYRYLDDNLPDFQLPLEFTAADWNRVVHPRVSYDTSHVGSGFRMRHTQHSGHLFVKTNAETKHTKREKYFAASKLKTYKKMFNLELNEDFKFEELPIELDHLSKY